MEQGLNIPIESKAAGVSGRQLTAAIEAFVAKYAEGPNKDLFEQMLHTLCKMSQEAADRGELKIVNRVLKEMRRAYRVFAPYRGIPKVSIFGSARTPEEHPQYVQARDFADLIQRHGWMVITGAGDGIMRAGHHGATPEKSFGVAISLPFEQSTNTLIHKDSKLVNFNYFFTRKLTFVKEAHAIALFPGGFGTMDEGFEALTLVQTGKSHMVPIVLCDEPGGDYWHQWRVYVEKHLLGTGMISREDVHLFHITDRAEDAVEIVLKFYRRFHSHRYVRDNMVMRLNRPLRPAELGRVNREFSDILKTGSFAQAPGPLDEENGAFPDKARLVFSFDRRSMGRLRQLIDVLNEGMEGVPPATPSKDLVDWTGDEPDE